MTLALRAYQEEAITSVLRAWETHHATLVVSPTGTGKTIMFCALAERRRSTGRVLVLAHREELVRQAVGKLRESGTLTVAAEIAGERAFPGPSRLAGVDVVPDVVVASVATLAQPERLAEFPCHAFATVIVDEAHHAVASTWKSVLASFSHARCVGFTATPDRHDERGLREVFEHVAFQYDLPQAIEDKWLVPICSSHIQVQSLDLSTVRVTSGDLNEQELARALMAEEALHEMVSPIVRLAGARPTLVFAASIQHAEALAMVLSRQCSSVEVVHGNLSPEKRAERIGRFRKGAVQFLVNCALLTEGFDAPVTSCVAICRPTRSRALYAQMVGRGTRLSEGKTDLLVIDFDDISSAHELVGVVDLLGGKLPPEVRKEARQRAGNGGDVLAAIHDAEEAIDAQARTVPAPGLIVDAIFEVQRAPSLVRVGGPGLARATRPSGRGPDLFEVLGVQRQPGSGGNTLRCSERQRALLERHGVDCSELGREDASGLIGIILERRERGLCSPKQAKLLVNHGLSPDVTFEEASRQIDALMQRFQARRVL